MPTKLTNLRIDEVSSVDRGAGEGVKVLLMKRKTDNATKALELALTSILGSDKDVGKAVEVFRQFHEHLSKGDEPKESEMTDEQIHKLVAEAVAKALEEAEKKKRPAKPTTQNTVSGDADKPDPTGGGDSAAGDTGKRLSDDEARKLLSKLGIEIPEVAKKDEPKDAEIAKRDAEIVDLRKHVQQLTERQQKEDFAKRATSIGLTADEGEQLRKAYAGDVASLKFLEDTIAKLHTQVEKAGLFNEIGDAKGASGNAHDELMAKALEIRKGNPKLTQAQAYVEAMNIYPDIAKREREESHAKIQKSAQ